MANNPQLTNAAASAAADAVRVLIDVGGAGYLRIYSGTQPATADTALSGNTLLAELRFGATAFGAASNGVCTANAITQDSSADATGTASFFRIFAGNGTTVILDGTVGTSGADINFNTVAFVLGAIIAITALTYTQAKT
jgi:hypothetical protein